MKNLILLRHAKSDWSVPNQKDIERELNERGYRVAPKMGGKLVELNKNPDLIICSTSVRTRQTVVLVVEQLDYDEDKIVYEEELYDASTRILMQVVCNLPNEHDTIMLVGHNPALTYFAEYITGSEIGNIPTCGVVSVHFDIDDWNQVSQNGILEWYIYPEQFGF